ncbi:MAG: ankyrin repeat domain-containing protein [Sphingobacteriia bacterium]|nr:ankyrin repeat domain-containing protein [Sphingobacteriia bacterium]
MKNSWRIKEFKNDIQRLLKHNGLTQQLEIFEKMEFTEENFINFINTQDIDCNLKDENDNSLLYSSIIKGTPNIVSFLIKEKNVDTSDAISTACKFGRTKVFKILLEHGAKYNDEDFILVARNRYIKIFNIFIKLGINQKTIHNALDDMSRYISTSENTGKIISILLMHSSPEKRKEFFDTKAKKVVMSIIDNEQDFLGVTDILKFYFENDFDAKVKFLNSLGENYKGFTAIFIHSHITNIDLLIYKVCLKYSREQMGRNIISVYDASIKAIEVIEQHKDSISKIDPIIFSIFARGFESFYLRKCDNRMIEGFNALVLESIIKHIEKDLDFFSRLHQVKDFDTIKRAYRECNLISKNGLKGASFGKVKILNEITEVISYFSSGYNAIQTYQQRLAEEKKQQATYLTK